MDLVYTIFYYEISHSGNLISNNLPAILALNIGILEAWVMFELAVDIRLKTEHFKK